MIARRGSRWLAPALMLGVCAALAWTVYREIQVGAPEPVEAAGGQAPPLPDLPAEPSFVMPPAEDFAVVLERPLFSPTRRPPSEAAPVITQAKDPIGLELTGVIAFQGRRVAILQPKPAPPKTERRGRTRDRKKQPPPPASIRLSEGDNYKGWTLEQIELDAALFVRGEEEAWLEMEFDVAAPVQPGQPRKKQAGKRRQRANDGDERDDDYWDATPDERDWIAGVLEGEGCSGAHKMTLDDGLFVVEDVLCMDGMTYRVKLDMEYEIVAKELYK